MLKKLFATGILMAFLGGVVVAAEYDGVIMKIDTEKKTIKAKVKIKEEYVEKDFTYTDDTTFKGKVGKKGSRTNLSADAISTALGTKRGMKRGLAAKLTTDGDSSKLTSVGVAKKKRKKKASSEE